MKLDKELEQEVLQVYNTYWDSYLAGDMETMASVLDDNVKVIGSTEGEVFFNKKEAMKFYSDTADQLAGVAQLRNRNIKIEPVEDLVLVTEQADLYILIDGEWTFYAKGRLSSFLRNKEDGWKFIHQHGSMPDTKASEGEQIAFEKISKENLELRDAVKRRTIELEQKNHELKIETALERVRAVAMGMKQPSDMLDVCRIISQQLQLLNLKDIRNVQTAIFYESKGTYLNYEFFPLYDKTTITEVEYKLQPDVKAFVNQMLTDPEAFFTTEFKEAKLKDWIEYQTKANQFVDPHFSEVNSLHYYFYSIGPGALGISTYAPLNENDIAVFKRFRNVFELAYRRFLDIEQALAQVKEAKIEAALERVRSRAMAMHKTDELLEAAELVSKELSALGIEIMNVSYAFVDEEEKYGFYYSLNPVDGKIPPFPFVFPHTETDVMRSILSSWKKQEPFNKIELDENATLVHQTWVGEHILNLITKNNLNIPFSVESFLDVSPKKAVIYTFNFKQGYLFIIGGERLTQTQEEILLRFTKVFDMTYRRFLDIQQAEAQAREAQIEAALERVRSKALAMQKSEDLSQAVAIVFEELDKLKLGMLRCGIGILNKEKRCANVWTTTISEHGQTVQVSGDESMDIHPLLQGAFNAWELQEDFSYVLEGDDLNRYYEALTHVNFRLPESQSLVTGQGLKQYYFNTMFQAGGLFAFRETPFPDEAIAVLKRFAGVFNLTYTRFNDLQLAEAQAHKAVIEEQKLREEKKRSDALLLNILPEEIANELKLFGKSYARKHEEVTILFSDIVGFSTISEDLSAEELVTQLDECFRAFDKIIEKHGLEKIKTVGDAYICACGLPTPVDDNATKTVKAAMDMFDFLKGFNVSKKIQDLPAFEFRIGIHTGPVVTGVVGLKKFTYDIWGDAVNMAARMEQHGEAGKINISGNTYQLIKDKVTCTHRGKIQAKNKGEVDMYFVESI